VLLHNSPVIEFPTDETQAYPASKMRHSTAGGQTMRSVWY